MKQIFLISWIAVRELLYERVFYLLFTLGLISLGISILLGQMTYAEQTKLTLDFMLGATELAMLLFSIFMGISLFHRELQMGSIAMLLSKPISRTTFILGKFIGQIVIQATVIALMGLFTVLICSRYGGEMSATAVFQTVYLIFLETAVLAAVTYFFAVNAGGITAAAASLAVFVVGHLADSFGNQKGGSQGLWTWIKTLVPNLDIFNTKAMASYGISVSGEVLMWATLYAVVSMVAYLSLASLCFLHRDIQT